MSECKIVSIRVPKEFDSEGFAKYLKVDEEEFWKTVVEFGVQGWVSLVEEPSVFKDLIKNNRYGARRVLEGGF